MKPNPICFTKQIFRFVEEEEGEIQKRKGLIKSQPNVNVVRSSSACCSLSLFVSFLYFFLSSCVLLPFFFSLPTEALLIYRGIEKPKTVRKVQYYTSIFFFFLQDRISILT